MNAEIAQNNAQSALTIAADQAAHDQTVAGAQAEDALAVAQAGALASQAASNAYFATLSDLLTAPAADTPITLTGNYGHVHDIGGHSVGNTADTIDAVMGLMFSTQPDSEPSAGTGSAAWAGMGAWSGSWLCGVGGQLGSALLGYLAIPSDPPPQIMLPGLGSTGSGMAGATWTNPAQTGSGGSVFGAGPGIYATTTGGTGNGGGNGGGGQPPLTAGFVFADPSAALNRQARLPEVNEPAKDEVRTNTVPRDANATLAGIGAGIKDFAGKVAGIAKQAGRAIGTGMKQMAVNYAKALAAREGKVAVFLFKGNKIGKLDDGTDGLGALKRGINEEAGKIAEEGLTGKAATRAATKAAQVPDEKPLPWNGSAEA